MSGHASRNSCLASSVDTDHLVTAKCCSDPTMSSIWLPEGVKRHTSGWPPLSLLLGLIKQTEATRWRCESYWLWATHTPTDSLTEKPNSTPFTQTHPQVSISSAHPAHLSLSTSLTSTGSTPHSWITVIHHRQSVLVFRVAQKTHRSPAGWGLTCHVSHSTISGSPARVSYGETGKNNTVVLYCQWVRSSRRTCVALDCCLLF